MDRNNVGRLHYNICVVALRKESVDRNTTRGIGGQHVIGSLSARRAWIEMVSKSALMVLRASLSARRAWIEMRYHSRLPNTPKSLSARRAWIEIIHRGPYHFYLGVALRKESVDRNLFIHAHIVYIACRSPQGERG